ncbi:titin-like [Aphidius gifuensis]|uniref:titin-like n=1 Tax=Aphidius gifuensis TaxID=684658 RepID=UPI001CDD4F21|nr:titin-like [Aphidius gifuensis]
MPYNLYQSTGTIDERPMITNKSSISVTQGEVVIVNETTANQSEEIMQQRFNFDIAAESKRTPTNIELSVTETYGSVCEKEFKPCGTTPDRLSMNIAAIEPFIVNEVQAQDNFDKYYPEIIVPTEVVSTSATMQRVLTVDDISIIESGIDLITDRFLGTQQVQMNVIKNQQVPLIEKNFVQHKEGVLVLNRTENSYHCIQKLETFEPIITHTSEIENPENNFNIQETIKVTADQTILPSITLQIRDTIIWDSNLIYKLQNKSFKKVVSNYVLPLKIVIISGNEIQESEGVFIENDRVPRLTAETCFNYKRPITNLHIQASDFLDDVIQKLKYVGEKGNVLLFENSAKTIEETLLHQSDGVMKLFSSPRLSSPFEVYSTNSGIEVLQIVPAEKEKNHEIDSKQTEYSQITSVSGHPVMYLKVDERTIENNLCSITEHFVPIPKLATIQYKNYAGTIIDIINTVDDLQTTNKRKVPDLQVGSIVVSASENMDIIEVFANYKEEYYDNNKPIEDTFASVTPLMQSALEQQEVNLKFSCARLPDSTHANYHCAQSTLMLLQPLEIRFQEISDKEESVQDTENEPYTITATTDITEPGKIAIISEFATNEIENSYLSKGEQTGYAFFNFTDTQKLPAISEIIVEPTFHEILVSTMKTYHAIINQKICQHLYVIETEIEEHENPQFTQMPIDENSELEISDCLSVTESAPNIVLNKEDIFNSSFCCVTMKIKPNFILGHQLVKQFQIIVDLSTGRDVNKKLDAVRASLNHKLLHTIQIFEQFINEVVNIQVNEKIILTSPNFVINERNSIINHVTTVENFNGKLKKSKSVVSTTAKRVAEIEEAIERKESILHDSVTFFVDSTPTESSATKETHPFKSVDVSETIWGETCAFLKIHGDSKKSIDNINFQEQKCIFIDELITQDTGKIIDCPELYKIFSVYISAIPQKSIQTDETIIDDVTTLIDEFKPKEYEARAKQNLFNSIVIKETQLEENKELVNENLKLVYNTDDLLLSRKKTPWLTDSFLEDIKDTKEIQNSLSVTAKKTIESRHINIVTEITDSQINFIPNLLNVKTDQVPSTATVNIQDMKSIVINLTETDYVEETLKDGYDMKAVTAQCKYDEYDIVQSTEFNLLDNVVYVNKSNLPSSQIVTNLYVCNSISNLDIPVAEKEKLLHDTIKVNNCLGNMKIIKYVPLTVIEDISNEVENLISSNVTVKNENVIVNMTSNTLCQIEETTIFKRVALFQHYSTQSDRKSNLQVDFLDSLAIFFIHCHEAEIAIPHSENITKTYGQIKLDCKSTAKILVAELVSNTDNSDQALVLKNEKSQLTVVGFTAYEVSQYSTNELEEYFQKLQKPTLQSATQVLLCCRIAETSEMNELASIKNMQVDASSFVQKGKKLVDQQASVAIVVLTPFQSETNLPEAEFMTQVVDRFNSLNEHMVENSDIIIFGTVNKLLEKQPIKEKSTVVSNLYFALSVFHEFSTEDEKELHESHPNKQEVKVMVSEHKIIEVLYEIALQNSIEEFGKKNNQVTQKANFLVPEKSSINVTQILMEESKSIFSKDGISSNKTKIDYLPYNTSERYEVLGLENYNTTIDSKHMIELNVPQIFISGYNVATTSEKITLQSLGKFIRKETKQENWADRTLMDIRAIDISQIFSNEREELLLVEQHQKESMIKSFYTSTLNDNIAKISEISSGRINSEFNETTVNLNEIPDTRHSPISTTISDTEENIKAVHEFPQQQTEQKDEDTLNSSIILKLTNTDARDLQSMPLKPSELVYKGSAIILGLDNNNIKVETVNPEIHHGKENFETSRISVEQLTQKKLHDTLQNYTHEPIQSEESNTEVFEEFITKFIQGQNNNSPSALKTKKTTICQKNKNNNKKQNTIIIEEEMENIDLKTWDIPKNEFLQIQEVDDSEDTELINPTKIEEIEEIETNAEQLIYPEDHIQRTRLNKTKLETLIPIIDHRKPSLSLGHERKTLRGPNDLIVPIKKCVEEEISDIETTKVTNNSIDIETTDSFDTDVFIDETTSRLALLRRSISQRKENEMKKDIVQKTIEEKNMSLDLFTSKPDQSNPRQEYNQVKHPLTQIILSDTRIETSQEKTSFTETIKEHAMSSLVIDDTKIPYASDVVETFDLSADFSGSDTSYSGETSFLTIPEIEMKKMISKKKQKFVIDVDNEESEKLDSSKIKEIIHGELMNTNQEKSLPEKILKEYFVYSNFLENKDELSVPNVFGVLDIQGNTNILTRNSVESNQQLNVDHPISAVESTTLDTKRTKKNKKIVHQKPTVKSLQKGETDHNNENFSLPISTQPADEKISTTDKVSVFPQIIQPKIVETKSTDDFENKIKETMNEETNSFSSLLPENNEPTLIENHSKLIFTSAEVLMSDELMNTNETKSVPINMSKKSAVSTRVIEKRKESLPPNISEVLDIRVNTNIVIPNFIESNQQMDLHSIILAAETTLSEKPISKKKKKIVIQKSSVKSLQEDKIDGSNLNFCSTVIGQPFNEKISGTDSISMFPDIIQPQSIDNIDSNTDGCTSQEERELEYVPEKILTAHEPMKTCGRTIPSLTDVSKVLVTNPSTQNTVAVEEQMNLDYSILTTKVTEKTIDKTKIKIAHQMFSEKPSPENETNEVSEDIFSPVSVFPVDIRISATNEVTESPSVIGKTTTVYLDSNIFSEEATHKLSSSEVKENRVNFREKLEFLKDDDKIELVDSNLLKVKGIVKKKTIPLDSFVVQDNHVIAMKEHSKPIFLSAEMLTLNELFETCQEISVPKKVVNDHVYSMMQDKIISSHLDVAEVLDMTIDKNIPTEEIEDDQHNNHNSSATATKLTASERIRLKQQKPDAYKAAEKPHLLISEKPVDRIKVFSDFISPNIDANLTSNILEGEASSILGSPDETVKKSISRGKIEIMIDNDKIKLGDSSNFPELEKTIEEKLTPFSCSVTKLVQPNVIKDQTELILTSVEITTPESPIEEIKITKDHAVSTNVIKDERLSSLFADLEILDIKEASESPQTDVDQMIVLDRSILATEEMVSVEASARKKKKIANLQFSVEPSLKLEMCEKKMHLNQHAISPGKIKHNEITSSSVDSERYDGMIELKEPNNVYQSAEYLTPLENLSTPSIGTKNLHMTVDRSLCKLRDTTQTSKKKSNDDQSIENNNDLNTTLQIHEKLIHDFTPNQNAYESVIFEVSPELAVTTNVCEEHAEQSFVHDYFIGNEHKSIASIQDKSLAEVSISTNETSYVPEMNTESLTKKNVELEDNVIAGPLSNISRVLHQNTQDNNVQDSSILSFSQKLELQYLDVDSKCKFDSSFEIIAGDLTEAPHLEMVSSGMIMEEPHTEVIKEKNSILLQDENSKNRKKLKKTKKRQTEVSQKKEWENWIEPDYERPVLESMPEKVPREYVNDKNVNHETKKLLKPVQLKLNEGVNKPNKLLFTHSQEQPQFGTIKLRQAVTTKKKKISSLQLPKFMLRSRITFVNDFPSEYKYSVLSSIAPNFIQSGILSRSVEEAVEHSKRKIEKLRFPALDKLELKSPKIEKPNESHNELSYHQQLNESAYDDDSSIISMDQFSVAKIVEEPVESELQKPTQDQNEDEELVKGEPLCFQDNTPKERISTDVEPIVDGKDETHNSKDIILKKPIIIENVTKNIVSKKLVIIEPDFRTERKTQDIKLKKRQTKKVQLEKSFEKSSNDEQNNQELEIQTVIHQALSGKILTIEQPEEVVTEEKHVPKRLKFQQVREKDEFPSDEVKVMEHDSTEVTCDDKIRKTAIGTVNIKFPNDIQEPIITNEKKTNDIVIDRSKIETKVPYSSENKMEYMTETTTLQENQHLQIDVKKCAVKKADLSEDNNRLQQSVIAKHTQSEQTDTEALKEKLGTTVTPSGLDNTLIIGQLVITEPTEQSEYKDTISVKTQHKKKPITRKVANKRSEKMPISTMEMKPTDNIIAETDEFNYTNQLNFNKNINIDNVDQRLEYITSDTILEKKKDEIVAPQKSIAEETTSEVKNQKPEIEVVPKEMSTNKTSVGKDENKVEPSVEDDITVPAIVKRKLKKQRLNDLTIEQKIKTEQNYEKSNTNLKTMTNTVTSKGKLKKTITLSGSDRKLTMPQLAITEFEDEPQYRNSIQHTDYGNNDDSLPLEEKFDHPNQELLDVTLDHEVISKTIDGDDLEKHLEYIPTDIVSKIITIQKLKPEKFVDEEKHNFDNDEPKHAVVTKESSVTEKPNGKHETKVISPLGDEKTMAAIRTLKPEDKPLINETIDQIIIKERSPETMNDNLHTTADTVTLDKKLEKTVASSRSNDTLTIEQLAITEPKEQPQYENKISVTTKRKKEPITKEDANMLPAEISLSTMEFEPTDYGIADDDKFDYTNQETLDKTIDIDISDQQLEYITPGTLLKKKTKGIFEPQNVIDKESTKKNQVPENKVVTRKISIAEKPIEDNETTVYIEVKEDIEAEAIVKRKFNEQPLVDEIKEQMIIKKQSLGTSNDNVNTLTDTITLKKKSKKTVTSSVSDDTLTMEQLAITKPDEQPQYDDKILVTTERKKKPITKNVANMLPQKILLSTIEFEPTEYEIANDSPHLRDVFNLKNQELLDKTIDIDDSVKQLEYITTDKVLEKKKEKICEPQEVINKQTTKKNQVPENTVVTKKIRSANKLIRKSSKKDETNVISPIEDKITMEDIRTLKPGDQPLINETIDQLMNEEQSPETMNDNLHTTADTVTLDKKLEKTVASSRSNDTLTIDQLAITEPKEQTQYKNEISVTKKSRKKPNTKKDANMLPDEISLSTMEFEPTDYKIADDDKFDYTNQETLDKTIDIDISDERIEYITPGTLSEIEKAETVKYKEVIDKKKTEKNQVPGNRGLTKKISSAEKPIGNDKTNVETLVADDITVEAIVKRKLKEQPLIDETIEQIIIKKQGPETLTDNLGTMADTITLTSAGSDDTLTMEQLAITELEEQSQYENKSLVTTKRKKKLITKKVANILPDKTSLSTMEFEPTDSEIANESPQLTDKSDHTNQETLDKTIYIDISDQQVEYITPDTVSEIKTAETVKPEKVLEEKKTEKNQVLGNQVLTKKIGSDEKPIEDNKTDVETLVGDDITVEAIVKRNLKEQPLIDETIEQIIIEKQSPETSDDYPGTMADTITLTSAGSDDTLTTKQLAITEPEEQSQYKNKSLVTTKRKKKLISKKNANILPDKTSLPTMKFEPTDYKIANESQQLTDEFDHTNQETLDKTIDIDISDQQLEYITPDTVSVMKTAETVKPEEVLNKKKTEKNQVLGNQVLTKKFGSVEKLIEDNKTNVETLVNDDITVEAIVKRKLKEQPLTDETIEQVIIKKQSPETLTDDSGTMADTITFTSAGSDDTLTMKQLAITEPEEQSQYENKSLVTTKRKKKRITEKVANILPDKTSLSTMEFEPTDSEIAYESPQLPDKFDYTNQETLDKTIDIDISGQQVEYLTPDTVSGIKTAETVKPEKVLEEKKTEKNQVLGNQVLTKKIGSDEKPIEDNKTDVETLVGDDITVEAIVKRKLEKQPLINETIEQIIIKKQSPETLNDNSGTMADTITFTSAGSDDTLTMEQLAITEPEEQSQYENKSFVTTKRKKKPITKKNENILPEKNSLSTKEFAPTVDIVANNNSQSNDKFDHNKTVDMDQQLEFITPDTVLEIKREEIIKPKQVPETEVVTRKRGSAEKLIKDHNTHVETLVEDDIAVEAIVNRKLKEKPLLDETIEQIIIKRQRSDILNNDLETIADTISLKEKLKKSATISNSDDTLTMQQLAIMESEDHSESEVQETTIMTQRQKKPIVKKIPSRFSEENFLIEIPRDSLESAEECDSIKLSNQIPDCSVSNKNNSPNDLEDVDIITLRRKPPKTIPKAVQDIFENITLQSIRSQKKTRKHINELTEAENVTYRPRSTKVKEDVDQEFQISLDTYEEENISMSGKIRLKSKKRPPTFSEETDAETIEVINEFENSEGSQNSDVVTEAEYSDEDLQASKFNLRLSKLKRKNEKSCEKINIGEASLSISLQSDMHELNGEKFHEYESNSMFSICPYIAETEEALNLTEGERVKIIDRSNHDWWFIKKYISEETGWVPAQYLLNKEQYTTYLQRKIHRKIDRLPIFEKATETSLAPRFLEKLRPQHTLYGCNAQFETQVEGVPRPQITWFKQSAVIKPSSDFQIFYNEDNLATLFIKKVFSGDTGIYTCVAKNAAGFASTTTELTVEGLRLDHSRNSHSHESSFAEIFEGVPPIFCQKPKTQCVIENSDVTLKCELIAVPKPEISWYHNDTKIDNDSNITITTKNYMYNFCSIMKIQSVQENQAGSYKIKAKNREGEASIDTFLKVKTCDSGAPEILEPLKSFIIHEGKTIVLSTHIIGTPMPNITWLKNGKPLEGFLPTQNGDVNSLTLVDTKVSDKGVYSCTASNNLGTVTTEAAVDVQENGSFEPPFFTKRFDELVVPENSTFKLIAKVEGNPKPEITWFRNNEPLEKSLNIKEIYDGENIILTIINADSETNSGKYECNARNSVGIASHGAKITVDVACPVFIKNLPDELSIQEFKTLELMCETSHTVSTIWWHNEAVISGMDHHEIVQDNHQHKLIIKKTSILDEGLYKCTVKNQSTSCRVSVKPVKPEFLRTLQDFEVTENDAAILEVEITSEVADVVWFKDSELLDLKNERIQYIKQGPVRKLVLSNISVHDEGEYMCKLFDQSCTAEVTVVELPPKIITKMKDVRTAFGDRAKFEIELTKGDALVHWFKDGTELQFSEHVRLSIDGKRQKLKVYNVQHDDAGLYVCQVGCQTSEANLIVERPDVEFIKRLPDITLVPLDTDASLVIEISKSDVPVQWFKNGIKVEESNKYEIVNNDFIRKLIIKECSVDDVMEYTAVISNVKTSTQLEIEVFQSPPKICVESAKAFTVNRGENIEMPVKFSASPKPIDKWSSNGLILNDSERMFTTVDDDLATLTIKNVRREDSKNYTLKLTNPYGDASTNIHLIVRCEPEIPQGPLFVKDIADDSVTIEWKPPIDDNGYPIVKYLIEMLKITEESWMKVGEVDNNSVTYRIMNLEKDSSYIFRLMAMNEIGFSEPLQSSKVKIESIFKKPGPPTGPLEILGMTTTSFTIKWNHPSVDGGLSIIDYIVDMKETTAKTWQQLGTTIYDKPYIDVTSVKIGSSYVFRISARNTVGTGASYISETPIVIGYETTPPSSPLNLWVSSITSRSVTLNWSPPTSTGNSELLGYIIEKKSSTDESSKWLKVVTLDVKEHQYCLENLKGSEFQFRIFAENYIGLSIPSLSEKITLKTHATVPSAPTAPLEIRQIAANTVIIEWGIPESDGGAAIEEYKIAIRDSKKTMWIEVGRVNTDIQKLTVRELQENHEYLLRIYARNEIGFSESLKSDEPFRIIPASELTVIEPVIGEMGRCETASVSYSTDNTSSWLRDHNMDADISSYARARLLRKDEYFFRIWHYAKKLFS